MSRELDEAMDAIPNLTAKQRDALIDFQIAELARYEGKATRVAKKDQSEGEVQAAISLILGEEKPAAKPAGKFLRRF